LRLFRHGFLRSGQNVFAAPLVTPSLSLEHLEHCDVFGVERVALDLLKMHGLQPPLSRDCNLFQR